MKIAICGYKGKTGSKVYELLKEKRYDVIGIEKKDKLLDFINSIDLLIDFTNKTEALKHIFMCLDFKKPFIVGTTGFTYDELNSLPDELRFRVSDILRGIQQQYVVSKNDVKVSR